jgi:hypothetical protein
MSRRELIARLLESDETSSFQFSAAWLNKQWTSRLRSLLLATRRQRRELAPGLDQGFDQGQPEALIGPWPQADRGRKGLALGALAALVLALAGWAATAAVQVQPTQARPGAAERDGKHAQERARAVRWEGERTPSSGQPLREGKAFADALRKVGRP